MIRKFLIPLAGAMLLGGCVTTAPYGYRGDGGDYYYGAPSVEYRYHGVYGDPYGYGPYRPGFSVWGSYGYPYYRNPYYGYPYYGYPYYGYPNYSYPRPRTPPTTNQPDGGPWRHAEELIRRRRGEPAPGPAPVTQAPITTGPRVMRPEVREMMQPRIAPTPMPAPMPRMQRDEGSSMGQMIRRARRSGEQDE